MNNLESIGFSEYIQKIITDGNIAQNEIGRIASHHKGIYELWTSDGVFQGRLAGNLTKQSNVEKQVVVGDWVRLRTAPIQQEHAIIEDVLKRKTTFLRGAAGKRSQAQIIAANIDVIFIVVALDGDYSINRIERYLTSAWASGASPVIILNKSDLCEDVAAKVNEIEDRGWFVPVFTCSALNQTSLETINDSIKPGKTCVFVGSSGVGKSTLINVIVGQKTMQTAQVRKGSKGRHTTTYRQLIKLDNGAILMDTPGMRELQLFDDQGMDVVFSDIEQWATQCKFRDCQHTNEPGCAVLQAVENGDMSQKHLDHFRQLKQEANAYERRHNARLKKQEGRLWGQLHTEVNWARKIKRGER